MEWRQGQKGKKNILSLLIQSQQTDSGLSEPPPELRQKMEGWGGITEGEGSQEWRGCLGQVRAPAPPSSLSKLSITVLTVTSHPQQVL